MKITNIIRHKDVVHHEDQYQVNDVERFSCEFINVQDDIPDSEIMQMMFSHFGYRNDLYKEAHIIWSAEHGEIEMLTDGLPLAAFDIEGA